jgi:putative nucleotidyltransferase with HDIG domain
MGRTTQRFSLLSHALDRVAFVAYFLGAVVPLVALAFVVQRYVLPGFPDGAPAYGLIGALLSIAALSLGSFFLLRRVTRQSLARLDEDKRRLETLLEASHSVADAPYGDEVLRAASECALRLSGAAAVFIFSRTEKDAPFTLTASAGEDAASLHATFEASLEEIVDLAVSGVAPVLRHGDETGWRASGSRPEVVAAVPLVEQREVAAVMVTVHSRVPRGADASHLRALSTLGALASVARHNAELRDAQKNFFAHVTEIMLSTLDSHMDVQTGHSRRVARTAVLLGREMGFDDHQLERLHFASLLHDIGMLKIDPRRTPDRTVYRKHTTLGFRMLKPIRLWDDIAPMVLHHHEWFDGNGYPEGLAGEAIPVESRIIGLAEAFDSMTSAKSYREPVSVEEAVRRIESCSGTQFDPKVVGVFLILVERGEIEASSDH